MRSFPLGWSLLLRSTTSNISEPLEYRLDSESECLCPCNSERDGLCQYTGDCYQPICPSGTYLCCASCTYSACVRNAELAVSSRGVRECVPCPPGHFCDGCDLPRLCPDGTMSPNWGNMVMLDCIPCKGEQRVSSDRTFCCDDGSCLVPVGLSSNYFSIYQSSNALRSRITMIVTVLLIHAVL